MFPVLETITGGGGLSHSATAHATGGPISQGGIVFGPVSGSVDIRWVIGAAALVALVWVVNK